ncbi:hypothetical protein RAS1_06960 [Phycisphaerae bacterium RAS1]|nr:hypothetical protein RAS1_06960 [Phycisphaerae bacterium RAS1]
MEDGSSVDTPPPRQLRLATGSLRVAAGLLMVVVVVWAGVRLAEISGSTSGRAAAFLATCAWLIAALGGAAALWALGAAMSALGDLVETTPPADAEAPTAQGDSEYGQTDMREVVALLREVRDISLLTERQRGSRAEALTRETLRRLHEDVPALLREHRWEDARQRVRSARMRFPGVPDWDELESQIESARSQVEARDLELATRDVENLLAIGAAERARDVVRDLLNRHPMSPALADLARRVQLSEDSRGAARLMAEAQLAADRRDWVEALSLANALIRRYPQAPEADALRDQLATLRDNAEIQTRKRMETDIRELTRAQRFGEALHLARGLIERYPNSPQAAALRQQLPRLEQRAGL